MSASAQPVIVSPVVWLVILSSSRTPLSSPEKRSRPVGLSGLSVAEVVGVRCSVGSVYTIYSRPRRIKMMLTGIIPVNLFKDGNFLRGTNIIKNCGIAETNKNH